MERDCVSASEVHPFDYVDFARGRPVGTEEPEGGPDTTDGAGHVSDICNKQSMLEGLITGYADRGSATGGVHGGIVNAEIDLPVVGVDESGGGGSGFGEVVDETAGGVSASEEVKAAKEVAACVGVD